METMNQNYEYHSYGKTELACMYLPTISSRSALATFNRWLKANKRLQDELQATGISPRAKIYTPLQVGIIFHYLGIPSRD